MMDALWGGLVGAFAWVVWSMNAEKRMVPDSHYYAQMAHGHRVPGPFWGRWLLPLILRKSGKAWEMASWVFTILLHAAVAQAFGVRAALLLAPMHVVSWNVKAPLQIDLLPLALVAVSLNVSNPYVLVGLALVAGACKQNAPLMMAVAAWSPWPILGLLGILPGLLYRRKYDEQVDKNPWLSHPMRAAFGSRQATGAWMSPRLMLIPWGLTLPLALHQPDLRLWLALALAYAPLVVAADNARLYLWALPVVLGYAVQAPVPDAWWGAILLANASIAVYAVEARHYTRGGIIT